MHGGQAGRAGEDGPGVGHDHVIMIDIGDPGGRVHLAGDLVHRVLRREARPDIDELVDALAGQPPGDPGQAGAVVTGGLPGLGDGPQ